MSLIGAFSLWALAQILKIVFYPHKITLSKLLKIKSFDKVKHNQLNNNNTLIANPNSLGNRLVKGAR